MGQVQRARIGGLQCCPDMRYITLWSPWYYSCTTLFFLFFYFYYYFISFCFINSSAFCSRTPNRRPGVPCPSIEANDSQFVHRSRIHLGSRFPRARFVSKHPWHPPLLTLDNH